VWRVERVVAGGRWQAGRWVVAPHLYPSSILYPDGEGKRGVGDVNRHSYCGHLHATRIRSGLKELDYCWTIHVFTTVAEWTGEFSQWKNHTVFASPAQPVLPEMFHEVAQGLCDVVLVNLSAPGNNVGVGNTLLSKKTNSICSCSWNESLPR
jgi:hypothetical protein